MADTTHGEAAPRANFGDTSMYDTGYYYEAFNPRSGHWSPVWIAEAPTIKRGRIQRLGGPGPRVRCLQPIIATLPAKAGDAMQALYGPYGSQNAGYRANTKIGAVQADIAKAEEAA